MAALLTRRAAPPGFGRMRAASPRPHVCSQRTLVRACVLLEDPYRTLGVEAGACEREIKAAYRKLALRYHPDVNPGCSEAERRFVTIHAAYEVLTGRRAAPTSGVHTRNQHNGWEFQDWFWGFAQSRRWSAQHHARPPQDAQRAPQERAVLHTQLAGLRQRAAVRNTARRREEAEATHQQQQRQHQHQQGAEQHPSGQQHEEPQRAPSPHAHGGPAHDRAHKQQQQQQQQRPPVVEYDSTIMSDGVNMANGEGYDPWSPEAAVAARRPGFTATETHKTQVAGQLGGLRRRAAIKRRADKAHAARGAAAHSGGGGGGGGSGGGDGEEPPSDV